MNLDENVLKEIAQELESGFLAYLHKDTGEIIALPDEDRFMDYDEEFFREEKKKVKKEKKRLLKFTPMSSRESFWVIETFIRQVEDEAIRNRLEISIQKKRPFANFKDEIDASGPYREKWFAFRTSQYIEWVREQWESQTKKDI